MKIRKISRKCLACGKRISMQIDSKGHYSNGNYFGKVKFPIEGKGKNVKVGKAKFGKTSFDVVKWIGKSKSVEYWECNKCFNEPEKHHF